MKQTPTSMVSRWFIAKQELDFTVKFVKGTENHLADSLSRLCPNISRLAIGLPPSVFDAPEGSSLSALTDIPQPNDEQLEA